MGVVNEDEERLNDIMSEAASGIQCPGRKAPSYLRDGRPFSPAVR